MEVTGGAGPVIALLGTVEIRGAGGPSGVPQASLRILLAALAMSANRVVSSGALTEALWQEEPSREREQNLHGRVYQLRRLLSATEPGRDRPRLATVPPGYCLELAAVDLDVARFRSLAAEGRALARSGSPDRAAHALAEALGLWRGPALADVAGLSPRLEPDAAALDEARLAVTEDWAEAVLATGRHAELAAELAGLMGRHPLRERLRGLLMLALYRSGGQARALECYEQGRRLLADELGVDPGPQLRQLHGQILRADTGLLAPQPSKQVARNQAGEHDAPPTARSPAAVVPRQLQDSVRWLPTLTDSFVGRSAELAEVRKMVEERRLVTITGPGGVGKTRLAVHVAGELADGPRAVGVAFVDASPLTDATLITDRLARVLGIRLAPAQPASHALSLDLRGQEFLIVLDNLEHLTGAAPVVAELLRLGEGVRVLATSRAPLHARGEHVYSLAPLTVAEDGSSLGASSAVTLFFDRASAADHAVEMTPETAVAVNLICRRLDGLPLAIELAAGRVRILPPQVLAGRLDRRLDLLDALPGDRPGRHQTLRATIDWSYQILAPATRELFRALAVLRGSFSIPAAAAVSGRADELQLLRELEILSDASMIEPTTQLSVERRFRMLETLREFALEHLQAAGEEPVRLHQHAEYICALAATAEPELAGTRLASYLDRLEAEKDNISSALRFLLSAGQADRAARAAASLWRFWHLRAHLDEGRSILEAILATQATGLAPALQADVLSALGSVSYWQRDYARAQECYQQALAICEDRDPRGATALAHYNLGYTTCYGGDNEAASRHFSQALAAYQEQADEKGTAAAISGLAMTDRMAGNNEAALIRASEALSRQRLAGDEFGATNTLGLLGSINAQMGNLTAAEALLQEALLAHEQIGNISGIMWMMHELAATAARRGEARRAVLLSAAAQSIGGKLGGGIGPGMLGLITPVEIASAQLSPMQAQRARNDGQQLTLEQAVAAALASTRSLSPRSAIRTGSTLADCPTS
jgi:predicted ATPase/DNA-binding SARP family transcriptional activator